jgi:hypothetical protein
MDKSNGEKRSMKRYLYLPIVAELLVTAGCMSPQGRTDYTATGALIGGATGVIIGSMSRDPRAGVVVGGAVGAAFGGLVGHSMDEAQEAELRAQAPKTLERVEQGSQLRVEDVKALVQAGISDELIIDQIQNSKTIFHLTTVNIIDLKNTGASDLVIDYMINTPTQVEVITVAGEAKTTPPKPLAEKVIVAPGPDYVWVGGAWFWAGDCWRWRGGYWHRPGHAHYPYGNLLGQPRR